jgi:pilus assembly protein CpaC
MISLNLKKKSLFAAALVATLATTALTNTAHAAPTSNSDRITVLSTGDVQQVNLPSAITDVIVSNPDVVSVDVRSSKQIFIFGKAAGEATVLANDASGRTVYKKSFRVGNNFSSIDDMLKLAMPEADINVTTMNGTVLLTGTVAQPEDIEEAERLASALAPGSKVISRLKNATPLQVNLKVRFAEVSRTLAKDISSALNYNKGTTESGGFTFAKGGRLDPTNGPADGIGFLKNVFGADLTAAFDLSERAGLTSILAEPNLTTVSGETAEFKSGLEVPFQTSTGLGTVNIEFKSVGVSLTYTPTVLSNGRISLRVKPEVSELASAGARIGGFEIPSILTRMTDTTVELGSGESIMISGLMQNNLSSSVSKMPGAGDIPILGALFKSNGWRRNETELIVVITPYLVKPVSDSQIALPTDGLHSPNDAERLLLNQFTSKTGDAKRPMPKVSNDTQGPDFGSLSGSSPALAQKSKPAKVASDAPGFSFE